MGRTEDRGKELILHTQHPTSRRATDTKCLSSEHRPSVGNIVCFDIFQHSPGVCMTCVCTYLTHVRQMWNCPFIFDSIAMLIECRYLIVVSILTNSLMLKLIISIFVFLPVSQSLLNRWHHYISSPWVWKKSRDNKVNAQTSGWTHFCSWSAQTFGTS